MTPQRAHIPELTDLDGMSLDELWAFREELRAVLSTKILAEKRRIEELLSRLSEETDELRRPRRHYPSVAQRYRNPDEPSQTWSGRGKTPHWVEDQLRMGKTLEDLRMDHAASSPAALDVTPNR